jgi:hypothetical protein
MGAKIIKVFNITKGSCYTPPCGLPEPNVIPLVCIFITSQVFDLDKGGGFA